MQKAGHRTCPAGVAASHLYAEKSAPHGCRQSNLGCPACAVDRALLDVLNDRLLVQMHLLQMDNRPTLAMAPDGGRPCIMCAAAGLGISHMAGFPACFGSIGMTLESWRPQECAACNCRAVDLQKHGCFIVQAGPARPLMGGAAVQHPPGAAPHVVQGDGRRRGQLGAGREAPASAAPRLVGETAQHLPMHGSGSRAQCRTYWKGNLSCAFWHRVGSDVF